MSVHYKFKTGLTFDKVTFDGVHISVGDLKKAIMQQKKIGKSADFDLQITNQQTKEVYDSEDVLIPKNTTVIIARVPVSGVKKHWERSEQNSSLNNSPAHVALDKIIKSSDLSNSNASEEEKIKQMMTQSTQEYDSSKFVKSRGMVGPLPPNYTCYRCGQPGHYIKHCPTNNMEIKRSTGIPRSFMIPASADQKGALLTASGEYAVPIIDHEAYKEVKKEKPPFMSNNESENTELDAEIPENLQCMLCRDLLQDAVLIHCCGSSYCDECIRTNLLESEQHECPTCHAIGISPDTLIPNRFLRTAVVKFKNETGYTKQRRGFSKHDTLDDSRNGAPIQESDTHDSSLVPKSEEKSVELTENSSPRDDQMTETTNNETKNSEAPTIDEILVGIQKESDTTELKENTDVSTKDEFLDDSAERNQCKGEKGIEEQEKRELTIDEQEEFVDSTANESTYSIANNRSIKQSMNLRPVNVRPVTSVVPQSMQMHRAPILPHPPRGIFPRPGIPPDPRFYRAPMRDPHAYSMGMGPSPYGYGAPPLRPHGYPDPFAFMSHRHPHLHGAQFPRPHISGHPQNYSEPPPPGSSPHNAVVDSAYGHYSTAASADYEDPLDKFAKQLQSKYRRKRMSRSRSKSRGRSCSRARVRRSRSRSSSSNSSSSKSRSLSFSSGYSVSSRSRSRSPYNRKTNVSNYRKRYSRSRSPRYRHDYKYRRSPSHRYTSSRRGQSSTQPRRSTERERYESRSRRRHDYGTSNQIHVDSTKCSDRNRLSCKSNVKDKLKRTSNRHSTEKNKVDECIEKNEKVVEKNLSNDDIEDNAEFTAETVVSSNKSKSMDRCKRQSAERLKQGNESSENKLQNDEPICEPVLHDERNVEHMLHRSEDRKRDKECETKDELLEKFEKSNNSKADKKSDSKIDNKKGISEMEIKEKEKIVDSIEKLRKDKYDKHRHYKNKKDPKQESKSDCRTKKDRKESTDDDSKKKHKHRKHKHHSEPSRKKSKKSVTKDEKTKSKEPPKSSKRKSQCK